MRRVELLSEKSSDSSTPGAVCDLGFPHFKVHKQTLKIGSFIGHGSRKALTAHVHRLNDTLLMTAVGQQRAAAIN